MSHLVLRAFNTAFNSSHLRLLFKKDSTFVVKTVATFLSQAPMLKGTWLSSCCHLIRAGHNRP